MQSKLPFQVDFRYVTVREVFSQGKKSVINEDKFHLRGNEKSVRFLIVISSNFMYLGAKNMSTNVSGSFE